MKNNSSLIEHPNRCLRMNDVCKITGLSRSYVYALAGQGLFPQSFPLVPGGTSRAWLESEVQEWIAQRINDRDSEVV